MINTDDIMAMDLKRLVAEIQMYTDDDPTLRSAYEEAITGFHIEVPIWYFTQGWYYEHPSDKRVYIRGYGSYPIEGFMKEVEQRKTHLRKALIDFIEGQEDTDPRS